MHSKVISGGMFLDWLILHGIVPADVRRVVIEADYQSAVKIYVEQIGTDALIKVEPPEEFRGAQVVIV